MERPNIPTLYGGNNFTGDRLLVGESRMVFVDDELKYDTLDNKKQCTAAISEANAKKLVRIIMHSSEGVDRYIRDRDTRNNNAKGTRVSAMNDALSTLKRKIQNAGVDDVDDLIIEFNRVKKEAVIDFDQSISESKDTYKIDLSNRVELGATDQVDTTVYNGSYKTGKIIAYILGKGVVAEVDGNTIEIDYNNVCVKKTDTEFEPAGLGDIVNSPWAVFTNTTKAGVEGAKKARDAGKTAATTAVAAAVPVVGNVVKTGKDLAKTTVGMAGDAVEATVKGAKNVAEGAVNVADNVVERAMGLDDDEDETKSQTGGIYTDFTASAPAPSRLDFNTDSYSHSDYSNGYNDGKLKLNSEFDLGGRTYKNNNTDAMSVHSFGLSFM